MTASVPGARRAIAVVGMSGRFPGARTLREFWQNLRNGVESLETFTTAEMEAAGVRAHVHAMPGWVPRGTVLQDPDLFDAAFFGYAPREAQIIDPQQRLFLECAWEAMENAGYAGEPDGKTVGIYAGSSLNSYVFSQLLPNHELMETVGGYQLMLGNDKDFLTTRASYKLDLHGPSMSIQTACSTSLVAVQVACQALLRGECDMALAGGVSLSFPQRTGYLYQEGMIFSPDGSCRPFDADAGGTRAGAGAGIVVLKRLDEAIADDDTIHAVILGAAINNDGAGKAGYTAPSVDGQIEAIATAQALAGVSPETITYIEAHGTATPLGDPIEFAALTRVYRDSTDRVGICAIGSLKANLGHLDAAAGVAGLIKTVLALKHREIPPQLNFRSPNPQLKLAASPFRVAIELEAWPETGAPRRAGVSSFGIGGTNAHVVLEEAPAPSAVKVAREEQLLVLSAKTAEALDEATANLVEYLSRPDAAPLPDVAYTLQVGRKAFPHRRSVVAGNSRDAVVLLAPPVRSPVAQGQHEGAARPVAFLFSGQGSQHAGMCAGLYRTEEVLRAAVDRCAQLLQPHFGRDIRELLWNGTDGDLSETQVAQPALFVAEYALAVLWMSWGVQPAAFLGHSIGEFVAAHLAGVFSLEDALMLVTTRGRLMQGMAAGEMLAVRLSPADLRPRLVPGVEIAAVNAPALCSVSGTRDAIDELTRALERDGIEHRPLHTSHAFHSAMMEPAMAPFREIVSRVPLSPPRRPIVSNLTGTWLTADQATSPEYWTAHLRNAVLFADGIATLTADPALQLLEVGPGNALTALARLSLGRDGAARVSASMPHPRESRSEADTMLSAAGRLWVNGVQIDWDGMHVRETLHRVPLPTYPFERRRHWVDAPSTPAPAPPSPETHTLSREPLDHWFFAPSWGRVPEIASVVPPSTGVWLIVGAAPGIERELRTGLEQRGMDVVLVRLASTFRDADTDGSFAVRSVEAADYEALLRDLRRRGKSVQGILHLANYGAARDESAPVKILHELLALGSALTGIATGEPLRLVVVTSGAQSVMGEPIASPEKALLTGPVLVLPIEAEGASVRAIDLLAADGSESQVQQAATAILSEAFARDDVQFVARRHGQRWTRRYVQVPLPEVNTVSLPVGARAHYLITGGLGGIGLTFAEWLASTVQARLTLTSRTAMPPRANGLQWIAEHGPADETSARIQSVLRIEALGGAVSVAVADVADEAAMRRALEASEPDFGPVSGVIHAAGTLDPALMATYSPEATEACVRAKVAGTQVLRRLLGHRRLDVVMLCSSISAVGGFAGSAAYGAGNAYLDAFAQSVDLPAGWNTVSIGWSGWRDVGIASRLGEISAERAALVATGIGPAEGVESFVRILGAGVTQMVVSPFDLEAAALQRRVRPVAEVRAAPIGSAAGETAVSVTPRPAGSSSVDEPMGDIEQRLAVIWRDLLGVDPVGVHDNFFELGGHSLMATRVIARIDNLFGVRLPLRELFNAPTIRLLAALVAEKRDAQLSVAEVLPSGEREEFEL